MNTSPSPFENKSCFICPVFPPYLQYCIPYITHSFFSFLCFFSNYVRYYSRLEWTLEFPVLIWLESIKCAFWPFLVLSNHIKCVKNNTHCLYKDYILVSLSFKMYLKILMSSYLNVYAQKIFITIVGHYCDSLWNFNFRYFKGEEGN